MVRKVTAHADTILSAGLKTGAGRLNPVSLPLFSFPYPSFLSAQAEICCTSGSHSIKEDSMHLIIRLMFLSAVFFAASVQANDKIVVVPFFHDSSAAQCSSGLTSCDGDCVDTLHDPGYCGDCTTACTADQYCDNGVCTSRCTAGCDDGDVCTDDSYSTATGCQHSATNCGDANACTSDSCDPIQGCMNTPISCDDANACTDDSCDTTTGCQHSATNCDDANACTSDSCDPIQGCMNTPISCDDFDPCTDDSCDTTTGCSNVQICQ